MTRAAVLVCGVALALACSRPGADLDYARALNAMDDERYDLARRYLADHLASSPREMAGLRLAARAWMVGAMQSPSRAAEYWDALLEIQPDDAEAHLEIANALRLGGDYDGALAHLDRLAPSAEGDRLQAAILLQTDPERALEFVERRMAAGSQATLDLSAAQACELLARHDDAYRWALLAVQSQPLSAGAHYLVARSLQRRGLGADAAREARIHELLRVVSNEPARRSAVERARAVDELASLLQPVPRQFERLRLEVLAEAAMAERGRTLLVQVLTDEDLFGAPPEQVAYWAERFDRPAVARDLLKRAIAVTVDAAELRVLRLRLASLLRTEDEEEAVGFLRGLLAEDPDAAAYHCLLGDVLADLGRRDAARGALERALVLAPWRVDCRLELARLLLSVGERPAVDRLLAEAPEPDPRLRQFEARLAIRRGADD